MGAINLGKVLGRIFKNPAKDSLLTLNKTLLLDFDV